MLVAAPLLWAGNAVVGRALNTLIPPITLNFVRWLLAFALLLPLAWQVLRPGSPLWPHWRRYALLGLLGIGSYNALQYLALQTSTPLNVTLVGSGMPVWMLIIGALCFGVPASRRQIAGVLLSVAGVVLVLSRGSWEQLLALRLVPGDLYMVAATISWSFYSWLLAWPSSPWARPSWPTAFGAWRRNARGRWWGDSSSTSLRCSRRCCPRSSSEKRRTCTTLWRSR